MKKKDEDAFLKSIIGTLPLKETDKLKKKLPTTHSREIVSVDKNIPIKNFSKKIIEKKTNNSNFILEKSAINKKLKKGKIPIDRKIDLHGYSVLEAEDIFLRTISDCYNKRLRCILFITGKGILKKYNPNPEETKLYYGKIRENFFDWVKKPEIQKFILSFEQASIDYGADGAFFVYLRKKNN